MIRDLDADVGTLARRIAELGEGERTRVFQMSWWSERMLQWAMSHPSFKTQLFRFVDVFPATTDDADVMRHLQEYFEDADVPKALDLGLDVAGAVPGGKAVSASVARRNITRMARQFIAGSTPREAVDGLHRLWRSGAASTVDILGEKTVTEDEANRYASRVSELLRELLIAAPEWAPDDHLERDDIGALPRVNLSLKPTALASSYTPLTRDDGLAQAKGRLRPILRRARESGAFVYFDMEHYDVKDLTLELARDLLDAEPYLHAGVVIQSYLKDSYDDLEDVIAWSGTRPVPLTVRLVKGAYWDAETVHSTAEGWPVPVFERKAQTDANFERCVRRLHDNHGKVRTAFGSHNLRSLAYAVSYARATGIPDHGYELQMLYGMAEPIQAAIRKLGLRLRVYAPVGELLPGMAYLVRRLLENTSNESFVRARFAEHRTLDELLEVGDVGELPALGAPVPRGPTDARAPSPYEPEPVAEWRRASVREDFAAAVSRARLGVDVPALIGGREVRTKGTIVSVDPGDTDAVVARSASCGVAEADAALEEAARAFERWRRTPWIERAAVLFRAAEWMRARRDDLAALEVFEAGKPWKESDADVCEAIDFCEYYGRLALGLAGAGRVAPNRPVVDGGPLASLAGPPYPPPLQSPPGETNSLSSIPRGTALVISPWNFPLAIPAGMATAALVTGNPVLLKPAEQTPLVAWQLVRALRESGLPDGVLGFLPGVGEEIGAYLVRHPSVATIAFTGSRAVGLEIVREAAVHREGQRHLKRVVCEMGGKNALVIDADADLDQAVPAAVYSAFGYAGQKCSAAARLIVHEAVYEETLRRLAGATRVLRVGHPRDMGTQVGPVIDADAQARVRRYVEDADGRIVVRREDVPAGGYYVGPAIVADAPVDSAIACEEIFGPVLTVLRAASFEDAIALANRTDYALTAGVFSRSPNNIRFAADELRAGNVYVNRHITGAVVGRQPFGGYGLSGGGTKAGGPDYLDWFVDPRVVTENTMRQGFAPTEE